MFARFLAIAAFSVPLALAQPATAKEAPAAKPTETPMAAPATPAAKPGATPSAGQTAARQRQKTCGAQWRALADAEKVSQGPKWPQYWSKCNKRLKGEKA
ncbi:hypothetical protein AFCDBAGC_4747 [Methylobacterium cerastii]|uniref:Phosphate starvation-inducible protein PsiF n=1 Tax=Methylobacterium cerastii TaxID=932741 RepID=A0ABQ4QNT0_9HYPH|nr:MULTISPECIES: hypothetical protein [Methylobacterium]TXM75039.1 hypothetical protein FV226_04985 [Methylobacterium sp. WL12]TXN80839.1 hypothetical protein FV234_15525 [Methylobacterium sp. WL8]GJD46862.1 hypothetical protein AFCDBAGC_4747 [Methylobacterium cerastii]